MTTVVAVSRTVPSSSTTGGASKGKKKNRNGNYFTGKNNIVAAELYDDLQEKIEQVKKVVRNRSKMDIALVLRSCEQADNAVDAAIAKLIGPDRGKECLQEWAAVQPIRKNKTKQKAATKTEPVPPQAVKTNPSSLNTSKKIIGSKEEEGLNDKQVDTPTVSDTPPKKEVSTAVEVTTPISSSQSSPSKCTESINTKGAGQNDKHKPVETKAVKRSKPNKKKPRPPKRIRDKLKQLVPPDNLNESDIFNMDPAPTTMTPAPVVSETVTTTPALNKPVQSPPSGDVTQLDATPPLPHSKRPTQLDTSGGSGNPSVSTSGNESGICSDSSCGISSTGTVSPIDSCSVVRDQHPLTLSAESFPMKLTKTKTNTLSPHNLDQAELPSFKKLLKDLHRCDVSLSRYQNALNEQCDSAIRELQKVFTILRIGLNTREEDIYNEIQFIRQMAGHILQRRKITCASLKKLSERASDLEEHQAQELKKQLKQFITERGIDEELGLSRRFIADPDDLLPSIMKFGTTCGVQPHYNLWNEFPAETVGKNTKPPLLVSPVLPSLSLMNNAPPTILPPIMTPTPPGPHMPLSKAPPPSNGFSIPFPIPPHAILNKQSVFNKIPILPTPPIPPVIPQLPVPPSVPPSVPPLALPQVEYINDEFGKRRKYSPEKLAEIQERVKESLKAQGVCLYNPFTGEAMKSEPPTNQVNSSAGSSSSISIKKTPTQQRRERKRRQKEREKQQKELMATGQQPKRNGNDDKDMSSKVGKPATSVTIIKTEYKPWWLRKYTPYSNNTTIRRPHPLTPPYSNKYSSKKSDLKMKDDANKNHGTKATADNPKITSPITVT